MLPERKGKVKADANGEKGQRFWYRWKAPSRHLVENRLVRCNGPWSWPNPQATTPQFNFTKAAEENNAESLLVIRDRMTAAMTCSLSIPKRTPYSLKLTALSHGWINLDPFAWDAETERVSTRILLPERSEGIATGVESWARFITTPSPSA